MSEISAQVELKVKVSAGQDPDALKRAIASGGQESGQGALPTGQSRPRTSKPSPSRGAQGSGERPAGSRRSSGEFGSIAIGSTMK